MKSFRNLLVMGAVAAVLPMAHAVTYNLNSDWSETDNPNGAWSLREGDNALPHVDSWQESLGGWSTDQPGWAESQDGNNRLPFFFKSNGSENFAHDWQAGDVVVHSTDSANGVGNGDANVLWTSQFESTVNVTGSVWLGRDIDRSVDWDILVNGVSVTGGPLTSGDVYSRSHPFDLLDGSGNSGSISNLHLLAGDTVELRFRTVGVSGDFIGMNLQMDANPVPEPATLAVLGLGGLAVIRRRRKA